MTTATAAAPAAQLPNRRTPLAARARAVVDRGLSLGVTLVALAMSLLPLSVFLLAIPAVMPQETILTDAQPPSRFFVVRLWRRLFALLTAVIVLLALLGFATEVISRLNPHVSGAFGTLWRNLFFFIPDRWLTSLLARLPRALVEQWPYVILVVYFCDLALLLAIGKVPYKYNIRNLIVRWKITGMTALAFTVVTALLTGMLAFVNGMNQLTEGGGIPGNVVVMSDGATDELFSNLGYGNIDNVERLVVTDGPADEPLAAPVTVKQIDRGAQKLFLGSRETYYVLNQPVAGQPGRKRFVQIRTLVDGEASAKVHDISLLEGEWFSTVGVDRDGNVQAVIGEGVAKTLGEDAGKARLGVGDKFQLGDLTWVVAGVMKTEGKTFGSEIWCCRISKIYKSFGKEPFTTLVLRVADDSAASASALSYHIRNRYTTQKLKAVPEPEYYAELNKTNNQFRNLIIIVAVVMAIGGVFGVMNTTYAAIAQRIRDIGVLRLLGFKRWQVLVSFLLESLGIALIGGVVGCALGSVVDGWTATSVLSGGGGGGGKSVILRLKVDQDVLVVGILFTLVMGRLGGLVPALSAMRLKILESLR